MDISLPPLQDSEPSVHDQTTSPKPDAFEDKVKDTEVVVVPPSSAYDAVPLYVAPLTVPVYVTPLMITSTDVLD